MGMPIREKQICSILISCPVWVIITPSGSYRWSLSRTMITASSSPYRPLFRTVNTAPSGPYSFLYPLLRFMQE